LSKKTVLEVAAALLHLVIACVAVPLLAVACVFSFRSIVSVFISQRTLDPHTALTLPLFPLQSTTGFLTALSLARGGGRFGQNRAARFVWVIPVLWFLLFFLAWSPNSVLAEGRWNHFLWSSMRSSKNEQLVTTLPLLTSIAYALGSHLGGKLRAKQRDAHS
jgi:hypothetical protein